MHNIGAHLTFYVRLWGPLWAWSCFGFEDWNAALLQSVHGTGDVTKQCLQKTEMQLRLNCVDLKSINDDKVKTFLKKMNMCGNVWTNVSTKIMFHLQALYKKLMICLLESLMKIW